MFIKLTILRTPDKENIDDPKPTPKEYPNLINLDEVQSFELEDGRLYLNWKDKDEDGLNWRDEVKESPAKISSALENHNLLIKTL